MEGEPGPGLVILDRAPVILDRVKRAPDRAGPAPTEREGTERSEAEGGGRGDVRLLRGYDAEHDIL